MPAIYESHWGFPLVLSAGIIVVVQTQGDGLVARDDGAPADGVQFLALIVVQVKAKLVRQQVAREDRVGPGVDEPSNSGVNASLAASETGTKGRNTGCPKRVCWGSSR